MKLKKGFTLAEVLIVLIIIGAIATMTIPSLMRGVQEAQWKTAYKKAFNAIVNICAMERVQGGLPVTAETATAPEGGTANNDATGTVQGFFQTLQTNLSVRDYANNALNANGVTPAANDYGSNVNFGAAANDSINFNKTVAGAGGQLTWINTEDGLSYAVMAGTCAGGATPEAACTKANINAATSNDAALAHSSLAVVVDVNGVGNRPNALEPQVTSGVTAGNPMAELTGDRYYIYIGADGASSGNRNTSVTGRITADAK